VVLLEGQSPCGIFILCQGRAKLSTASREGKTLVIRIAVAMTHEEISQLVGTSRETITRLLSEFCRNETAELKGSTLSIHNQPALKNVVRA
jgi:CRP-like cAMP-binding protein